MEAVLQWGLNCITVIQSLANQPFGNALTVCMRIVTELGSAAVYIMVISLMYWCVNEKKSLHLGIAVLISVWLNLVLKLLLDQPRPFFPGYNPSVGMIHEKLGGLPSGHAQNSLVLLVVIASWGKKKWFYGYAIGAAAFFCLLIGFSRVYLGVHFPTDVFGGWLLGGIILCGYFFAGKHGLLHRPFETLFAAHAPRAGTIACAALAFIMTLYPSAGQPLSPEMLMPAGMFLGLGTGYILCKHRIGFSAVSGRTGAVKYLTLCARFVLGMAIMAALFMGTGKAAAFFADSGNYRLIVFLRFGIIAFWVSAGAPWLFVKLHLFGEKDLPQRSEDAEDVKKGS